MGQKISLFSSYKGKENRTTNYCGLMFRLVYDESPFLFEELLTRCVNGEAEIPTVGPIFEQQKRYSKAGSVPDLEIRQESIQILFEVKNTDWYHEDQLDNHIQCFGKEVKCKILILLCNFEIKNDIEKRNEWKKQKRIDTGVSIIELSFKDLVANLHEVCHTELLENYLVEFEEYLDRNELLPTWDNRLDVVNCVGSIDEVLNEKIYACPAEGRPYSHRRAKYFGVYYNKKVHLLFQIDGVAIVEENCRKIKLKYNNTLDDDSSLVKRAKVFVKENRNEEIKNRSLQVFLLSNEERVSFIKDSDGGMYGSKIYFDIECNDVKDLAVKINGRKWSSFRSQD